MKNLLVLLILVLSLQFGVISYAKDDSVCDVLGPPAAGLCKAYCDVLECNVSDSTACEHLLLAYANLTGVTPPCEYPCTLQDIIQCGGHVKICSNGQSICTSSLDENNFCFGTDCP